MLTRHFCNRRLGRARETIGGTSVGEDDRELCRNREAGGCLGSDAEGGPLYPRRWNDEFIGTPVVEKAKQRRQTVTSDDVTRMVAGSKGRYRVLFPSLVGTGIRIGEGLALKFGGFLS